MKIIQSISGVLIRLTQERMGHIKTRHPEMAGQENRILETVTLIAVKHYPKTPLTEKFCAVVYKEISKQDGFIVTAYFTSKPAEWRNLKWKP